MHLNLAKSEYLVDLDKRRISLKDYMYVEEIEYLM